MPPSSSSAYSRLVLWYGDATDTNDAGVRVSGAARLPPKSAISPPDGPTRYVYFSVNATPSPSRALGTRVQRAAAVLRAVGVRPDRRPQRAGEIGRHRERSRVPRHRLARWARRRIPR